MSANTLPAPMQAEFVQTCGKNKPSKAADDCSDELVKAIHDLSLGVKAGVADTDLSEALHPHPKLPSPPQKPGCLWRIAKKN